MAAVATGFANAALTHSCQTSPNVNDLIPDDYTYPIQLLLIPRYIQDLQVAYREDRELSLNHSGRQQLLLLRVLDTMVNYEV